MFLSPMPTFPRKKPGAVVHLQPHLQNGLVTCTVSWCPLKDTQKLWRVYIKAYPTDTYNLPTPNIYSIYIPYEFWVSILKGLQLGSLNESLGIRSSSTTFISYNYGKSQPRFLEPFTIFHPLHIYIYTLHIGNICAFHLKFPTLFSVESNQPWHSARSNSRFAISPPTCLQVPNVSSVTLKDREV